MDARVSTSALLFVIGAAPVAVMVLIGAGAPSSTVAEILHSVNAKDGRIRLGWLGRVHRDTVRIVASATEESVHESEVV
jgi:hypothetical protein